MQQKTARSLQSRLKIRHILFLIVFCIIILILIMDYLNLGITYLVIHSDVSALSSKIDSYGIIGYLLFISIVAVEVMLAPIPGFILYVTGAVLFGWKVGGILTILGNMIGATLAFYLANYMGREYVEHKVKEKKWDLFDRYAHKYGGYAIFFLRINPFTSSDIFSYLAGFSKMPFKDFFWGTFFGLLPLSFAQTYFGESVVDSMPTLYWVSLGFSILYLIAAVYFLYIGWFKNKNY